MKKQLIMRGMKLFYILATTVLFGLFWNEFYGSLFIENSEKKFLYTVLISAVFLVLNITFIRVYSAFSVGSQRLFYLVYSQALALAFPLGIFYVFLNAFSLKIQNPLPVIVLFVVGVVWSLLWSFLANRVYNLVSPPRKTIVVYQKQSELRKLEELGNFKKKFHLSSLVQSPLDFDDLSEQLTDAETVFLLDVDQSIRDRTVKHCVVNRIQCYVMPRVGDVLLYGADTMQTFSVPFLRVCRANPKPEYLFLKRAVDIFASLVAIILAGPFMLITALAIKLYDGGPVFYKQVRLTKDHKEFKVLKFRSMRTDAEKDGVARLATEHDDRITPVGKLIRKIRFDELPQLFNILKGDMTIVGPRPERPEIAAQYEKEIPSFGLRLQVKAGLTGYAQIYGRYNTEPYDKLKMDLIYIEKMSFAEDLRLMFATVKILFIPESTTGIEEGQTTASHAEQKTEETVEEKIEELV